MAGANFQPCSQRDLQQHQIQGDQSAKQKPWSQFYTAAKPTSGPSFSHRLTVHCERDIDKSVYIFFWASQLTQNDSFHYQTLIHSVPSHFKSREEPHDPHLSYWRAKSEVSFSASGSLRCSCSMGNTMRMIQVIFWSRKSNFLLHVSLGNVHRNERGTTSNAIPTFLYTFIKPCWGQHGERQRSSIWQCNCFWGQNDGPPFLIFRTGKLCYQCIILQLKPTSLPQLHIRIDWCLDLQIGSDDL